MGAGSPWPTHPICSSLSKTRFEQIKRFLKVNNPQEETKTSNLPWFLKLEPLLSKIRLHAALVERTPGCFYRKSKAYLHFHEDPSGTFADIKLAASGFTRVGATTQEERARLLALIERSLKS